MQHEVIRDILFGILNDRRPHDYRPASCSCQFATKINRSHMPRQKLGRAKFGTRIFNEEMCIMMLYTIVHSSSSMKL